ncbi:MAG: Ribitol-5-phosphate cytidylyltransferase [Oscillospiraceae bacterium]|jgi:D-ribitol-5-phosphate cytidylyltransferase
MNYALIFAGGTGQRMNSKTKPKQFLELHGKPIIIYTLEHFEQHKSIDGIVVACLESWIPYLETLLEKFHITKVKKIVPGGNTTQQSIYNGVEILWNLAAPDSIVLVHDGVRPLINMDVISNNIKSVQQFGNAITVSPVVETVAIKGKDCEIGEIVNRSQCRLARAPQSFFLKDLYHAHQQAKKEGKINFIDCASLMRYYGHKLMAVEGPIDNIKITTPSDFYIFRALEDAYEDSQIFGL